MTRVSLKEAYDNKDVIAQIYAIRDTAESAVDTSEQAVTTANTASEHVDALVPQVEGAVQNANSASASAQASAQTVAGYENRLATVEDATEDLAGDLNAVTLRVTTAEGDIVTIQGRVTALETADGQNVKINAINDYAVGLTGNQGPIGGSKQFLDARTAGSIPSGAVTGVVTGYACVLKIPHNMNNIVRQHILVWCTARQRDDPGAILAIYTNNGVALGMSILASPAGTQRTYTLTDDGDNLYLYLTGTNSNNDLLQTSIIGRTEFGALSVEYMNNMIVSTPLGTVIKSVTVGI